MVLQYKHELVTVPTFSALNGFPVISFISFFSHIMGQVIVFPKIGRLSTKIVMVQLVQSLILARFCPSLPGFPVDFPWSPSPFPMAGVRALRAKEPGRFQSGQEEMGLARGLQGRAGDSMATLW